MMKRSMKETISAEAIANNIDLLTEILVRLPVKPLIKCKCVSKRWLSLISNPQFSLSHTRHHHNPYPIPTALLFMSHHKYTPEIIPLKHDTIPKIPSFDYLNAACVWITQSCNGLLLFKAKEYIAIPIPDDTYYICNPTTKQFKSLSFPSHEFTKSMVSIYMAFDPLKSNHYKLICVLGIGVKEVDKYQILIGGAKETDKYQIETYSSETDSWSPLGITFTPPHLMNLSSAIFCNGAVHWCSKDKTSVFFDVDTECLKTMPMPEHCYNHELIYFGESRGNLHLIQSQWHAPIQFDVLEMAPDYSGWFVRYHVDLDAVRIAFPKIYWDPQGHFVFTIAHVIRAQNEEESTVVLLIDNKAISFNVHNGTLKKLCDMEPPHLIWAHFVSTSYFIWSDTPQYFEILTSV